MRNATLSRRVGRLETVNRSRGPQADRERRALAQVTDSDLELLVEASHVRSSKTDTDPFTVEQQAAFKRYEQIYNATCALLQPA